jgi:N-formylglutamate amidohydrolase
MYFESCENENSPIICNVPHSGTLIPEEFILDFSLSKDETDEEVKYMADNYTDNLYSELISVSSFIKSKISRVVLDIERFKNEEDEPMSKVGMSALYRLTSSGKVLRNVSEINKKKLEEIYDDYHNTLTKLVSLSLDKNNIAIIVDCHSFPSKPRGYESDKEENRPDVCIGVDEFHTPKDLVNLLKVNFEEFGFSVKINSPFSGSIVPLNFYKKDKKVVSVMIEVNRNLYMNEETFQKLKTFSSIGNKISRCMIKSINQFLN